MGKFRVIKDAVSLLISHSSYVDPLTDKVIGYDHETITVFGGQEIDESKISPIVVKLYDSGDEHTRSVIERIEDLDDSEADVVPKNSKVESEVVAGDSEAEPIDNYDSLGVGDIIAILKDSDDELVSRIQKYEELNKGRVTILSFNESSKVE